jgi:hypothetical protein
VRVICKNILVVYNSVVYATFFDPLRPPKLFILKIRLPTPGSYQHYVSVQYVFIEQSWRIHIVYNFLIWCKIIADPLIKFPHPLRGRDPRFAHHWSIYGFAMRFSRTPKLLFVPIISISFASKINTRFRFVGAIVCIYTILHTM